MATVPLWTMREELTNYYKLRGWSVKGIPTLPDNKLIAIYFSYLSKGFPLPEKKPKAPALKSQGEQLCLF